jgi:predicted O-methyltransferase YrrM
MDDGLTKLLSVNLSSIRDLRAEFSSKIEFHERMNEARNVIGSPSGMNKDTYTALLYAVCRILRPKIVVETGVANGFSSASILQALEDNGMGELYSIDLHYREGVTIPVGKELGWVIPEHLKHRWCLVLGESFKVLPRLLKKLGKVDIFLHDSRHTYRTMMKEYRIVWPYLREGGLLLSDDVEFNDAFLDFCAKVACVPVVVSGIGATVKEF